MTADPTPQPGCCSTLFTVSLPLQAHRMLHSTRCSLSEQGEAAAEVYLAPVEGEAVVAEEDAVEDAELEGGAAEEGAVGSCGPALPGSETAGLIPHLGVGVGFRRPFLSDLFLNRSQVDFLEIISEHYMDDSGKTAEELDLLAGHFTLIPHGLGLSLGGAEGLDPEYLRRLASLVKRINPPYWSEHIAFTRAGGVNIGHLTPVPYTWEAVNILCRNIERARRFIPAPLILENITYHLTLPGAEMTEAQFVAEVLERADCGLLLDVTNLYTNSVNHDFNPQAFLDQIPLHRITQLHFTGGHHDGTVLVDSHSQPTPSAVWDLMAEVCRRSRVKGIILERDENLPPFADLVSEMAYARRILEEARPREDAPGRDPISAGAALHRP